MIASDAWDYFYKSTTKYKNNNTYYSAWCKFCLTHEARQAWSSELDRYHQGIGACPRTEEEIVESCMLYTESM
ncbi:hypothetical protein BDQ17DRAFT_365619 [Cyathus striatus]|nr:hypothetical protein BDQ17DRAFT_365619 [Cyathus striatus]